MSDPEFTFDGIPEDIADQFRSSEWPGIIADMATEGIEKGQDALAILYRIECTAVIRRELQLVLIQAGLTRPGVLEACRDYSGPAGRIFSDLGKRVISHYGGINFPEAQSID